ncbi:MAG TPA: cellulase family glycosylhydrolase [Solirubrobacteraceae bacterium]|jgi:hypothetical protein
MLRSCIRSRTYLCALLAATLLIGGALADAGSAAASSKEAMYFEAPGELLNPETRGHAITQLLELGVHAIRVEMSWSSVAPGATAKNKPSFNATNPAYYDWGESEQLINEVHKLGWQVLLTVSSPVPRWATSNKKEPYVTMPDDRDFKEFMTAVGKKFRSEVTVYSIWNEPNEHGELQPQFNSKGEPIAGRIYRGLFQAGYEGLHASGLGKPIVLMGETSPGGATKLTKNVPSWSGIAPLTFLRNALCLNTQYKRAPSCGMLKASGYAQHPYALDNQGPFDVPDQQENVTLGTIGRLTTVLNKAAKAGAVKANLPIYLTEYGVVSKPNKSATAVSTETQADYDAISERLAWANPRVAAFSQYLLEDDLTYRGENEVSFQTGLEYSNGGKKPAYNGFMLPLTVTPTQGGYNLWGLVRPAQAKHKGTTITVLVQRHGAKSYSVLKQVHTGPLGYWTLKSSVPGAYWKVRWTSPEGKKYEGPRIKAYNAP